jgi:hypothetical protein
MPKAHEFVRVRKGTVLFSGLNAEQPNLSRPLFLSKYEAYARAHAVGPRAYVHRFRLARTIYLPRKEGAVVRGFLQQDATKAVSSFLDGSMVGSSATDLPAAKAVARAFHGWAHKITSPHFSEVMICQPMLFLSRLGSEPAAINLEIE